MTDRENLERQFGTIVRGMASHYTIWFEGHYAAFEYKDSVIHCIKPGEQINI